MFSLYGVDSVVVRRNDLWALVVAKGLDHVWGLCKELLPAEIPTPFYPELPNVFKALEEIEPEQIKYVVVGQDPYWTTSDIDGEAIPDATGVAFTVPPGHKIPPSLKAIQKAVNCQECDLRSWRCRHGVLLLNAALTVPRDGGMAGAHLGIWAPFTQWLIGLLKERRPDISIIAWGAPARQFAMRALKGSMSSGEVLWCYHPQARYVRRDHEDSFQNFWKKPTVRHLVNKDAC